MLGPQSCSTATPDVNTVSKPHLQGIKRLFLKLGTCSRTLFYILNREFGHPMEIEERASAPLAGGVMQKGYQCGMLWGASLAVGAESFRRHYNSSQAICTAIAATQNIMESFSNRTKSVNCRAITNCDFTSKLSMMWYMLSFKFMTCFFLAENWVPEAIQSATEGLSQNQTDCPQHAMSCASEVAKKLGASNEEMIMVAGFSGGLGLSGNACGALSAAIWIKSLNWCRKQTDSGFDEWKSLFENPDLINILNEFYRVTNRKILCSKISKHCFKTISDHSEFIKNGGCKKLIDVLVQA